MKVIVAGLGKTGTTALFAKLQAALPAETRCLFEPRTLPSDSAGLEHVLAKVLIGVGRTVDIDSFDGFDRKILLTRDPRDTLVSRVLYDIYNEPALCADAADVDAFVGLVRRKEADPASVSMGELIRMYDGVARRAIFPRATQDPGVALEFQRSHPDYLCYRYDDLIRAEYGVIERFLGITVTPGVASVPAELRRVARAKSSGDWRHWLTPSDVELFRPHFAPYLAANGYSDDWTLSAAPKIARAHASEYVLQLVGARRSEREIARSGAVTRHD